jgi:hypothetical protein
MNVLTGFSRRVAGALMSATSATSAMPEAPAPSAPLYRRALGADFARLAPVLQKLHDGAPMLAVGELRVRTARRGAVRALMALAPWALPEAADQSACVVTLTPATQGQCWRRLIGGKAMQSLMRFARPGLLLERMGPLTVQLRTWVDDKGRLRQSSERVSLCGVPLPDVHVSAIERAIDARRYACHVRIWSARWGRLLSYDGVLAVRELAPGLAGG